tara:strand:- start:912 stop:1382 length:471 start_codon:yes stop_codon:yes gene_type:complete
MYNWCYTWDHDVDQYNLAAFIDENKVHKENWWSIYESKDELSEHTLPLRTEIQTHFGPIEYMGVWDYYEGFVDDLGPHKDSGDNENAVVFFCPRGELTVTMHDEKTKEVLETKVLNNTNAMCLYHTQFIHDIQGVGDLVVFGLSKEFDAVDYFTCE